MHIPEDSPAGARAAATAIVSGAAPAGLTVVAPRPNTARLIGDSPWEFLRSIGVSRVRIDFGFSVAEIFPIASVLPIAVNTSTLRAADLAPFADLDVELIHNFYPQEWTGLALSSVAASVSVARQLDWRVGASIAGDSVRRGPLGEGLPTVEEHRNLPPLFQARALVDAGVNDVTSEIQRSRITRSRGLGRSSADTNASTPFTCHASAPPRRTVLGPC